MTHSAVADLLVAGILLLIAGHCWYLHRRRRWLTFDPLNAFWAGVIVCYVMQPVTFGELYSSWHADGVLERSLLWSLVAFAFVVLGYESRIGVTWGNKLPSMPRSLSSSRLVAAGVAFVALGLVGYGYLFSSAGGAAEWLAVGRGATDWDVVSGYVTQLEHMLPVGVTLLLYDASLHRPSRLKKIAVVALGGLLWLWLVYLGSRSRTIAFTLALLAVYYLPRRRQPSLALLGALFIALFGLVTFQAEYRGRFTNLSLNLDEMNPDEVKDRILPTWVGGRYQLKGVGSNPSAEFNCVMTVVELVPDRIDYNYGYSHLEVFTRPIPRAIWPEKRYPHAEAYTPILREGGLSSTVIPTAKEPLLMGPSFTFVGHWYSVGGPIALLVFGTLTGAMLRAIRTIYDRSPGCEGDIVLFSSLIMLGFGEASGEPLFFVYSLPFTHGPLVLALLLSGRRRVSADGNAQHGLPAASR